MLMKKILLAGIAAGALAAGSAEAATITAATIATKTVLTGSTLTPYTIPTEKTVTTGGVTSVTASNTTFTGLFGTAIPVSTSFQSTSYLITFTTAGGARFNTSGSPALTVTGTGFNTSTNVTAAANTPGVNIGTVSYSTDKTTATVIVTISAPTSGTSGSFTGATLASNIETVAGGAAATVTFGAKQGTTGGFIDIDGGVSPAVTVLQYKPAINTSAFAPATATLYAALSDYKKFTTESVFSQVTPVTSAALGTVTIGLNSTAGLAGTNFYADLADAPTAVTPGTILGSSTLTVAGPDVVRLTTNVATASTTLAPSLTNSLSTTSTTVGTATFAVPADGFTRAVVLTQPVTALAIQAGTYTASLALVAQSGYTAPTITNNGGTIGTVTLQGTNLYIPWVNDGVTAGAGNQTIIRIGNIGKIAATTATVVLINPTGTTSAPAANCNVFTLPAYSATVPFADLTISSANLQACFGNFGRSDLVITLPTSYTNLSAKIRIQNSSTGLFTEQSVGAGAYSAVNN
jgi:hypothetical protein